MGGTISKEEFEAWQKERVNLRISEPAINATLKNLNKMSQPMQLLTSHESKEWYTPEDPYIKLVRQVLGDIDLDPASNEFANKWIKAKKIYTIKENGLLSEWHGRVFLNSPYGKTGKESNMNLWLKKMEHELKSGRMSAGIALVNSTHGYDWYEDFFERYTCCLVKKRIRFIDENGKQGAEAKRGQSFFLFHQPFDIGYKQRFKHLFSKLGRICDPDTYRNEFYG